MVILVVKGRQDHKADLVSQDRWEYPVIRVLQDRQDRMDFQEPWEVRGRQELLELLVCQEQRVAQEQLVILDYKDYQDPEVLQGQWDHQA